jgi:two-component system chemotaxis response regulator CheY
LKVLVVEDSSFARMAVTKVVGVLLPTAEFFEAADGETGLALFQTMQPDLVLTDLLMPKLTGEELIRSIRQLDATVPIIVMTANIQKPARDKVEALGVTGFVTKPVIGESIKNLRSLLAGGLHVK